MVPRFDSIAEYTGRFTDAAYWRPYVEDVSSRHGLAPVHEVQAGMPGTFPVFIVDRRYVVKLYGEQFDGPRRWAVERAVYELLRTAPQISAPQLLASGHLFPDAPAWSWPYLVTSVLPGTSLGEVREAVSYADYEAIVGWLGRQMRAFYALPLPDTGELSASWERFTDFMSRRRAACVEHHRRWSTLPEHLLEQIEEYVLPVEALIDRSAAPRLLHADLNEDHVLGQFAAGRWIASGMIDFADVLVGDPLYDLIALHIGLAHCDKHLLRIFLVASGQGRLPRRFVHRAMSYTLLFEHNALGQVLTEYPATREASSLAELATALWDLEQPGLLQRTA